MSQSTGLGDLAAVDHLPTIDVVSIARNHETGLRHTLESINKQDWPAVSVHVVDGASTDDTARMLTHLQMAYPLTSTSERDSGIYDAMNKGWRRGAGDLVIFMNAGDAFANSSVISTMAESWRDERYDWGYGLARVLEDGKPLDVLSMVPFSQERLRLGLSIIPHQATVMSRALLEKLGGFDVQAGVAADQALLLRASTVSKPRLWAEFFADFEGGGIGSSRSPRAHLLEMQRARREAGLAIGPTMMDSAATGAMRVYFGVLKTQTAVRKRLGLHG